MKMDLLKIIRRHIVYSLLFLFAGSNNSLHGHSDSVYFSLINKTIQYLSLNQIKKQNGTECFIGEWPTFIQNLATIPYLGKKGKSAYDSNIFNTFYIHNGLAEYYLNHNADPRIISILSKAQTNFDLFKKDSTFNFWPELPRPDHVKCSHFNCTQRRANNFYYHYKFINEYANIYNDADDTSAGYMAYYYSNQVKKRSQTDSLPNYPMISFGNFFSKYRDTGERKANWYNKRIGFKKRTGAFLTWFGPDRKPSNFFNWFKPYHDKQNILYGTNEVDCIVNANILRSLYLTGDTLIAGIKESKQFIKDVVAKRKCLTCGVYYPSEFSFHYAVAKAISDGVTGLNDIKDILVQDILNQRNKLGYWSSQMYDNDVQSTLYAINALILLSDKPTILKEIEPALNFILKTKIEEGDIVYWRGGIFFSGGSAVRYEHVWRSESYVSILALEAFSNYLKLKKES